MRNVLINLARDNFIHIAISRHAIFSHSAQISELQIEMAGRGTVKFRAGYECTFVEELPSDLLSECSICLHVLREPYMVGCCGYRFCHSCIDPIQRQTGRCPLCNNAFTALPDKHLERVLKAKLVYCSHKGEGTTGCEWQGKLDELEKHLVSCKWQEVLCSQCGKSVSRYALTKFHEEECPSKWVTCSYCKAYEGIRSMLKSIHYPVCPMYPVSCPNNCGEKPPRKNLLKHVDNTCPLTVVDCSFRYAGCDVQLPRKEMERHSDENLDAHLAMSMSKITELSDENLVLKKQLQARGENLKYIEAGCELTEYVCVTNLPACVDENMLKSVFGQHGKVCSITLKGDELAIIDYYNEDSAVRALLCGKGRGVNLKSHRLCLSPVYRRAIDDSSDGSSIF